jgi:hypothetical protein
MLDIINASVQDGRLISLPVSMEANTVVCKKCIMEDILEQDEQFSWDNFSQPPSG